jgi:hypothetical protein
MVLDDLRVSTFQDIRIGLLPDDGLLALLPQYFLEAGNGLDFPPAINHPEYYFGFIGVAVVWQNTTRRYDIS